MEKATYVIIKRSLATGRLVAAEEPHEHGDKEVAILEARRLSRLQEDTEFVIFEAIGKAVYQPVQVTMIGRGDFDERFPF
jgi:hypothetical protein